MKEPGVVDSYPQNGQDGPAGVMPQLAASVQTLSAHVAEDKPRRPVIPWEACHPAPMLGVIQLTAGAGSLNLPDYWGPSTAYWWDLRSLGVWGFTGGTVTIALNIPGGAQIAAASTPGEFDWSSQRLLGPDDHLVFTATGITGAGTALQLYGQAIEIQTAWLPEYLM